MGKFCFRSAFIGGCIAVVLFSFLIDFTSEYTVMYKDGYKKGQIDAWKNNIKYELAINKDKTIGVGEIKK